MSVKYIVHGKSPCAYCRMAVDLLKREGMEIEYINTEAHEVSILKEALLSQFNVVARTFPQIIKVDGIIETYIGGFTELREHFLNMEEIDFDD